MGFPAHARPLLENLAAATLHTLALHSEVRLHYWRDRTSLRHSTAGLRAFAERFPRFAGRCYLVAPEVPLMHPPAASSGVGSLPPDQFLLAVGRQAEAEMIRNLWSPR